MIVVALVLAFLALLAVAWRITRAITRPLAQSVESLDALANKDLTRTLEVTTSDETAAMASRSTAPTANLKAAFERIATSSDPRPRRRRELMTVSSDLGIERRRDVRAVERGVRGRRAGVAQRRDGRDRGRGDRAASIAEIAKSAGDAAGVADGGGQARHGRERQRGSPGRLEPPDQRCRPADLVDRRADEPARAERDDRGRSRRRGRQGLRRGGERGQGARDGHRARHRRDLGQVDAIQIDTETAVDVDRARSASIIDRDQGPPDHDRVGRRGAGRHHAARSGATSSDAARGTTEIAENVAGVAHAAESTAVGVGTTRQAAEELARMADELESLVSEFTY